MNPKILQAITYHANQLAKNFGLQAAEKEDIQQELTLKALTVIHDFEEGNASLVTYVKRCLTNKASDIARELRDLAPVINSDEASVAMELQALYKYTADRHTDYVPLTVSMGEDLRQLALCEHEHNLPLKMDVDVLWVTLTPRQKQIAELLEDGKTLDQIAEQLGVAKQTIHEHIRQFRKIFKNCHKM